MTHGGPMDFWHDELEAATTECELLHHADDLVRLWMPSRLAPAMLGLARFRIDRADDLHALHEALGHRPALPRLDAREAAHVRELAGYLRHAVSRLRQVRADRIRPAERAQESPLAADAAVQRPPSPRAEWAMLRRAFR